MKLLIHIGAHKTASTLLQHKFKEHADEFEREGIYYSGQTGKALAYSMLHNNEPERKEAMFISWAHKLRGRYIIVSSEGLWGSVYDMYEDGPMMAWKIDALGERLKMETEILAFVRRSRGQDIDAACGQLKGSGLHI